VTLIDAGIEKLRPYQPGKPIGELERELGTTFPDGVVKLASNENPLGPSARAVAAAVEAAREAHRYPDGGAFYLRRRLATHLGVRAEEIIVGSGSNEIIDLVVQTFCAPDEEVLTYLHSFLCYGLSAACHRRPFREVPTRPDLSYDVDALVDAVGEKTKVVFLANPNNPTGVYMGRKDFARLCERLPPHILLAVDEAYFEYARAADYPNALEWLKKRELLLSMRTFSKIYGLAGFRVGYGVGGAQLIEYLNRVRLPFNVGSIGQAAAEAALSDVEHVEKSRQSNAREIQGLAAALAGFGLEVTPSQGNFLLTGLGGRSSEKVYQALLRAGVIVRPMDAWGLPGRVRITVGTTAENARLLEALKGALGA
jgi:histidinol-phosphate aminotransferase